MFKLLFLLSIIIANHICYSQVRKATIVVEKNISINSSHSKLPIIEPFIAVSSVNNSHMVTAAIVVDVPNDPGTSRRFIPSFISIFTTFDGGQNWLQHDLKMKMAGDPWLSIRPDGKVLLTLLAMYDSIEGLQLAYYSSADGGKVWTNELRSLGKGFDHQTMDIDKQGRIYLTAVQEKKDETGKAKSYVYLNYSDDGISFQKQPGLFLPNDSARFTQTIKILPDGSVMIPYFDMHRSASFFSKRKAWFVKTFNAGKTFSKPGLITGINSPDLAIVAVDTSQLYTNRIYYLKNTGKETTVKGPAIHFSDDMGESWSNEILIDRVAEEKFIRRAPQMTVNKNGVLGIAWIDRQEDPERKKNNVWFTASIDGGKSFLPKVACVEYNDSVIFFIITNRPKY
jgi:hypothetical protein